MGGKTEEEEEENKKSTMKKKEEEEVRPIFFLGAAANVKSPASHLSDTHWRRPPWKGTIA